MADPIDPAIQQAFRDFARQLDRFGSGLGGAGSTATSTLTNFGSSLRTVGQGMARLRTDMDSGRRTFAESVQVYRQLRDDFENLGEATRSTAAGQRIREAQNVMANQLIRQNLGELAGEITKIGLVGALNYYKNQMVVPAVFPLFLLSHL
jgi:pyridoxal biosynthesis lyase PdxS